VFRPAGRWRWRCSLRAAVPTERRRHQGIHRRARRCAKGRPPAHAPYAGKDRIRQQREQHVDRSITPGTVAKVKFESLSKASSPDASRLPPAASTSNRNLLMLKIARLRPEKIADWVMQSAMPIQRRIGLQ
jgi:hypothetical protein